MTPESTQRTRQVLQWLIVGTSLGFAIVLAQLCGVGDFFNSYPFITDDGFDWIFEGHGLHQLLTGSEVPVFPVLRAPGFVCVTALDAFLGAEGGVIVFVFAGCFAIGGFTIIAIARLYQAPTAATTTALVAYLLSPVNFFRLFVLADAIALTLMLVSTYFLLRHVRQASAKCLLLSAVLALAGAMTQTYAAIPFLVGLPLVVLRRRQLQEAVRGLAALFAVVTLFLLLRVAWRNAIPHGGEPSQFSLLEISLNMAGFYGNVWTYLFLPVAPGFLGALYHWAKVGRPNSQECVVLGGVLGAFVALTFFYQWPEARFTFIYFPIPLVLFLVLSAGRTADQAHVRWVARGGAWMSVILVSLQLCVTPDEYWRPSLRSLDWQPARSWIGKALAAKPEDRLGLGVSTPTLPNASARIPPGLGPYKDATFGGYLAIHNATLQPRQSSPQVAWSELVWAPPDAPGAGFVESMSANDGQLQITGWAAQRHLGPALRVFVYAHENMISSSICNVHRADVNTALGLPEETVAGYSTSLPFLGARNDIVVVAVFTDGRSHRLPIVAQP